MISNLVNTTIQTLQNWPIIMVFMLLFMVTAILLMSLIRFFGKSGLFVFIPIAVITANIQALKAVHTPFFEHPIALGTILFSFTYLATDILAEFWGTKHAQRGIWFGFVGPILITMWMIITIGMPPLDLSSETHTGFVAAHEAMSVLFTPSLGIFVASLFSFLVSQFIDVYCFQKIKSLTHGRFLWLRSFLSSSLSALIDNTIFSFLAWHIFLDPPLELEVIIYTYILGTYSIRIAIAFFNAPLMYIAKKQINDRDSDDA